MTRPVLVTGASGKQGGAVVQALLDQPDDIVILAVTRNPDSASAQKLAAHGVKLVKGDLDNVPAIFEAAKAISPTGKIWGVFSVQATSLTTDAVNIESNAEVKQGIALIDQAVQAGVTHFVYSSVDRGGEERSWENPTDVPHFRTKAIIETHLRDTGSNMTWAILRPAIFMDNITPDMVGKGIMTSVRDVMGDKKMPWIAVKDIGFFGAMLLRDPKTWNGRALSLGSDAVNFDEINKTFRKVTGQDVPTTYSFIATGMRWALTDMGKMFAWFKRDGYNVDSKELKRLHPGMLDLEAWLRTQSAWKTK
ncbi:hypothetical protein CcaverHIS002_0507960 [Cutaneotrichosporon cavernicola]|uniref:NmrA-like domain-containing protein n=1 Tax=Cutaneotrichosporon cavernicola TaxID=279322 RepID=A0AA48QXB7_9TREE|nr:uncharacterized protein CcaverHIS019_0508540 [Cutaneotrichosporon cavernicola]BEI85395.1 hypothetical protein CcaverHIS002_0507960 [Cutaneotrichosporon cavernicola]BEI93226.1 hypothetical protein CcaverHIS019_0508540 [Cutaneotrichosporon cavernicola]BEJ01003.1 hypothetical protein CcaverHIS631_0508600 [Cutaneotrichosporon cavernicola]BEJ08770.1 hypothetical protein CcaverHIS641_0508640 [Cutaneotrichosporon cavernicola]